MKFELKTDNENYSKSFSYISKTLFIFTVIIIFCNVAIKLGIISRHYQIEHYCKILSVSKSNSNFKKLSKLSSLKSKQKIWEFCNKFLK